MRTRRTPVLVSALTLVCALALALTTQPAPAGAPPDTVTITFALLLEPSQLPDTNGDGIPDALPDLLADDSIGVLFGGAPDATTALQFSGGSPPCGPYDVAGEVAFYRTDALLVAQGEVTHAGVYWLHWFGPAAPPYHQFLRPKNIHVSHACWLKEDGSGKVIVQEAFDTNTVFAIVIVEAEFRVKR